MMRLNFERRVSMNKKSLMVLMVACVFGLSLFLVTGCAKKSTIKDAATTGAEQTAVQKQAAAGEQPKAAEPAAEEKVTKPQDKGIAEASAKKTAPAAAAAAPQMFDLIYFDYDKYDLKPESRDVLQKVADFMKGNGKYILRVEGHCDERGTAEYNLALGQRRADAAMSYLLKLGIDKERVTTLSYGKELPLDPASTEEAWAKNRRDNFVPIATK
jgi:peptidoglycan-associated lipoprotein